MRGLVTKVERAEVSPAVAAAITLMGVKIEDVLGRFSEHNRPRDGQ